MIKYYSIYDAEGKVYRDPFSAPSDADAARMVTASMLTSQGQITRNSPLFMYASQFVLVRVGEWFPQEGVVIPPLVNDSVHAKTYLPETVARVDTLLPKETDI